MRRVVPVREAMTEKVLTATPDMTVAKAAKLMSEKGVGSIVIVKGKKPIGILTERDVLQKVVSPDLRSSKIRVGKIMSTPLITIHPDVETAEAARVMVRNRIRHLPVVKQGNLVGIITASDLTSIPGLSEEVERPEIPAREEIEQSVCEVCGEVTSALYEINGMWVCENCRDFLGG